MKYGGIIYNDFAAAPGVCLTFFEQGCPLHCPGCHNPGLQSFDGGKEFTAEVKKNIIDGLTANGVHRDFCVMGGEPLCPENEFMTQMIISFVKETLPNTKVYVWSGYTLEELESRHSERIVKIFQMADYLIDGPYKENLRDVSLFMRGSSNQRVISLDKYKNL